MRGVYSDFRTIYCCCHLASLHNLSLITTKIDGEFFYCVLSCCYAPHFENGDAVEDDHDEPGQVGEEKKSVDNGQGLQDFGHAETFPPGRQLPDANLQTRFVVVVVVLFRGPAWP